MEAIEPSRKANFSQRSRPSLLLRSHHDLSSDAQLCIEIDPCHDEENFSVQPVRVSQNIVQRGEGLEHGSSGTASKIRIHLWQLL